MPLYKEWESDAYSLAAIWHIEEPEDFFVQATGIVSDIKNEKRRMERLAGRYLLQYLEQDFPLHHISPDEHDKPRIPENQFYFSISHSWPYVAAIVSPYVECGIDIQTWHKRIKSIAHKFLSDAELSMLHDDDKLITLTWCAKEAAYKWQGRRGVEFIDHLVIEEFKKVPAGYQMGINLKLSLPESVISLQSFVDDDFALAYVQNK